MKYLLMIQSNESAHPDEAKLAKIIAQHNETSAALRDAGKWVDSHRLEFSKAAKTLRRSGASGASGDWLVTDGPFAEAKELLGGFYLIDADSPDEAVEWAKRLPVPERGSIEVRPCRTGAQWRGPLHGGGKSDFAVLFVADTATMAGLSREEVFASIDKHYEVSLELAAQGKFIASRSLGAPGDSKTIRRDGGALLVSDGPFAETREFVAGYFVISADSMDEALDWARELTHGLEACEVRPVWGPR